MTMEREGGGGGGTERVDTKSDESMEYKGIRTETGLRQDKRLLLRSTRERERGGGGEGGRETGTDRQRQRQTETRTERQRQKQTA